MERLTKRNSDGSVGINDFRYYNYQDFQNLASKLADYEDAVEQGLLLRLPCDYNESLYWITNGKIKEVWFKGIRCDKGYKPQIIARYMEGLSSKEEPITNLDNIGKTVFLTKEEAEKALADMKGE